MKKSRIRQIPDYNIIVGKSSSQKRQVDTITTYQLVNIIICTILFFENVHFLNLYHWIKFDGIDCLFLGGLLLNAIFQYSDKQK